MAKVTHVALLSLFAGIGPLSASADDACKGELRHEHNMGIEHFVTTSRVYEGAGVHVYETCVENLGSKYMWAHWRVPGPTSYIPPGGAISMPRPFMKRNTMESTGCLEYGGWATTIKVPYIGHASDADALARDSSCNAAHTMLGDEAAFEAPFNVGTDIRLFVPSDSNKPEDTMMEFIAYADAKWSKDGQLEHGLSYSVKPLADSTHSNPDLMTIRIDYGSTTVFDDFLSTISRPFIDQKMLGMKDLFYFQYGATSSPELRIIRYEIFDQNDKLVGAFAAPIWIPSLQ